MGPHWQPVLGCLCLVVSAALGAAMPTPDTMVVARSDDGLSSTPAPTIVTEAVTEAMMEDPNPPIKIAEMDVTSNIALRYAHTAVVTTMRNPARRAQEAHFRVLLPETAFISSFTMILDGKSYKAYVKEKEEAKQIYNHAVSQGLGAAHVQTKARDSNHFTVSVNVEPNTVAVFNLTYEELLVRRNGVYNHAINLHPGTLVPKLTVTVRVRETQPITVLRVPEVRTGNEIDATAEDAQNLQATIEQAQNKREATITFKPDLTEQRRLLEIYWEKIRETHTSSYNFNEDDNNSKDRDGVLGQFVVQYDVERPQNGEILVNDGYFVHFYAPSDLPPLRKHCVFVLDTSGSMMDRKIVQLRKAMETILGELNSGDYFNIVEFASWVVVHELDEKDRPSPYSPYGSYLEHNRPRKLVEPSEATPENVAKAKIIVSKLHAAGGTNIYSALDVAVDLINKGVSGTSSSNTTSTSTNTTASPQPTSNSTDEDLTRLEPIIIFLTDGDPTVGQTDPTRIINHLTEKNSGMKKATIYSLAFGEDADRTFLRKLSLRNDGFMRHIYEGADAALQLRDFYRQVSSPLLADVKFVYPIAQVKADSLTKHRFRRYYLGSETVVAGSMQPDAAELTPTVSAFCGVDAGSVRRKYMEILPPPPVAVTKEHFLPLERLWAYLTVKQLLDEMDARDSGAKANDEKPEKKALDIALKYSFVTPLTSLVVVKPNATDAVDAESVHKQNNELDYSSGISSNRHVKPRPPLLRNRLAVRPAPPAKMPSFGANMVTAADYFKYYMRPNYSASSAGFSAMMQRPLPQMHSVSVALSAVDYDEDDNDFPQEALLVSSTPVTENPLRTYHLEDYAWLSSLLVGDAIEVPTNTTGGKTRLKLSENTVAPRADSIDEACAHAAGAATEGASAGVCVYVTRCDAARNLTALTYPAFQCSVGADGYAGVCCPKDKVDVEKKN